MAEFDYVRDNVPELWKLVGEADRWDIRSVECGATMRGFIAALVSYMPGWLRLLYRSRGVFVRLLGERQEPMDFSGMRPEEVSFVPGDPATFFHVAAGEEGRFWVAEARDRILSGYLAVAAQPLQGGVTRYHVLCMARYRHWTAHIYYNVINLFHHIVVSAMVRHAVAVGRQALPRA